MPLHDASRPDMASLELLVAVVDLGSVSAAASALGLAQPNASRQLSRLERRLGARLVERGARGSEPTAAGRAAVEHARRVLDAADGLVEQVRAASGSGPLRILASQTIAEQLMPTFLAALAADYPEGAVTFEVVNTAGVLAALRRGRGELGFIEGPDMPQELQTLEVAQDELVAVVAPEHPWATDSGVREAGLDADTLAATPLVVREEGSGTRDVLARALAPRRLAEPALELHSNAAVRTAVAGRAGCAVLSRLAVARELREGRLVEVPVRGVDMTRSLRAVWRGVLPGRVEGALQAVIAEFGDRGR
ncbi:LysR family transcriptional regulator [Brachybacterium endophyticum]|uniref:LysR family transcriptional regulator n=1 Tax=Brachybacterium endophyticum TaxID=2182385 RepID=A0A2U2RHT9_9MICO|nr:LysR family transcriptional regulator [Brachybacterium endophyticum]PWH05416.1 LysR family transcriptional regulator [Brachybacterium endophyticum]